jgi:Lrp/AsnC family transcriptional regulator, leucine-responsive regulatory protein
VARIDEVNLQILRLLQANGRMSLAELAQAVGRSESSTRERVSSLEMDGFVLGYQARIDWSRVGLPAHAVIRARCDLARTAELAAKLSRMPHVTGAFLLTGGKPILITMRVRDMAHLHSILREELAQGALQDIEAEVALESIVEQRPPGPPVVAAGADLMASTDGPAPRASQVPALKA